MPHASLISPRDLRPGMKLVEQRSGGAVERDVVKHVERLPSDGVIVHFADLGDENVRRVCLCVDDRIFVSAEVE